MPRKPKDSAAQTSFLENTGTTAPAVPAVLAAVREWRKAGYKGATATTQTLLNYWFHSDHKLRDGRPFKYHYAQQEAVESMVYVWEIARARTQADLYTRFIPAEFAAKIRLPEYDAFARYCVKMATGSGKTKVMALAIAWQYLNAIAEANDDYARTFLILAPNVIVFERLKSDFGGGMIFRQDPIIPKELQFWWEMQFYMRGESERASSMGALYLTNVQQLHERESKDDGEPDIMSLVLGKKPAPQTDEGADFRPRLLARGGRVVVLNDEAHHTHDPASAWNETIRALHEAHPDGIGAQLDFSATPRYSGGGLFAWTISDYTLKQAIIDRIVKRPIKGVTDATEAPSDVPSIKYEAFLTAGVERWREYREQLAPMAKKPLLFIMLNNTEEADGIADYLQRKYPDEFRGDKTLVIHIDRQGEVSSRDLDTARKAAREVDRDDSPVNAIVSVLMLREGWDVQNVTVVVGLRPYTSKANILPEQTIGRGLRLMFRGVESPYQERVDIIGNPGFIQFVEQLEKEEGVAFEQWKVGKDKLTITTIEPVADKAQYDIALPVLSPILTRATSLQDEIMGIDIFKLKSLNMPRRADARAEQTFRYMGIDVITLEQEIEREYRIPTPQTSGEIVGYIAQVIAHEVKLPSQFTYLAPKVRDFLRYRAFDEEVDLDTPEMLAAISQKLVVVVTVRVFRDLLREKVVQPQTPKILDEGRRLSELGAFPWSQQAPECRKTVLNRVPCDNNFEESFARFLDRAPDVDRFSKLPMNFGFTIPYSDIAGNLRYYYPDFIAVDESGTHTLIETKGREDRDVANKDRAATLWAENATALTHQQWTYVKVLQKDFEELQPADLAACVYLGLMQPTLLDD